MGVPAWQAWIGRMTTAGGRRLYASAAVLLVFSAMLLGGCSRREKQAPQLEKTLVDSIFLRRIGVADRRLTYLNAVLVDPEAGIDARVLQTSHTSGTGKVVLFQPRSGKRRYLDLPGARGSWAATRRGREFYIGSHMPGYLYHLVLNPPRLTRIPLPRQRPEQFDFVWSVDFGSDGNLYLGTYPDGALLRFHPGTGRFENLGVMVPGENYVRRVTGEFPGKIYCGIGAHAQLVEYDIVTGKKTAFLPPEFHSRSFVYYTGRFRDMLLAAVTPDPVLLFFDPKSRRLLRQVAAPHGSEFWLRASESFVQAGSDLYFGTTPGDNLYRYDYDSDELALVREGIGFPFGLAHNRYLFCLDYVGTYSVYDLQTQEVVLRQPSRFEGAGMNIYAMASGPDGTVAGGTYINQGFFLYDPRQDRLRSLGAAVRFGGQITSLTTLGGRLYLGHYRHARLSVYDPRLPWQPGSGSAANPHVLGSVGHQQDRVPAMYAAENGRIYLGTIPEYGKVGGALAIFDPETGRFEVFRNLVRDQSVVSLAGNGTGLLFGGTDIHGGLGVRPAAGEGQLFVWDMAQGRKVRQLAPIPGAAAVRSLSWSPSGLLIGAADSAVFVYDDRTQRVVASKSLPYGLITNILVSRDGWYYGVTPGVLFRFTPDLQEVEEIYRQSKPGFGHVLAETSEGRLFLASGALLYELVRSGSR